ncbi:NUDIX domain-containing protein [Paenibacillus sp. 5J-6]|uniref:NUDIX domain-containing protein n=1 Tax=Paenibacillus silvestris TaxID=2606219 RepID=A0A6L8V343_9BACL|nr:NUDIX domain-containing protein [Paenibacillus silvestris]MZQ84634.1 NUDIX domain-containing protein [Paenibacillus silvestris]
MTYPIRVRACALIIENEAVLLVEFEDEDGIHYNLPAGGVESGESVIEAVKREAWEEAAVDVEVGPLAFVSEHAPHLITTYESNSPHGLSLMFDCKIKEGSQPTLPANPDMNQVGVRWVSLSELDSIVLYPNIKHLIKDYARDRNRNIELVEEYKLAIN